jgi:cell wall-associated NlpC family hydrolase
MMRDLGPLLTDDERDAFIAAARTYLGVRFKHQGRSRNGVDCVGLCVLAMQAIGRTCFDAKIYSRHAQKQGLRAALVRNLGEPVPKDQMRDGDIALMAFASEPSHVGIVTNYSLGGFALLHTFAQMKKVVEHRMDEQWMGYISEVFRP